MAPAHPLKGMPADQLSSLTPPVISLLSLPLACCLLAPSPLPCFGPPSAVFH